MFAENLNPRSCYICPYLHGDEQRQVSIFSFNVDSRLRGNDKQKIYFPRENEKMGVID